MPSTSPLDIMVMAAATRAPPIGLCILDHFKPSAQLAALMRGKTLHMAVHIHVHV